MKGIIIATGIAKEMDAVMRYNPTLLLAVVDKPIIIHVIEHLVRQNIHELHLILNHWPDKIENLLGDGRRWGIRIKYQLVKGVEQAYKCLAMLAKNWPNEFVLVGQGDMLPEIEHVKNSRNSLVINLAQEWSGWGWFNTSELSTLASDTNEQNFLQRIQPLYEQITATAHMSTRSYEEWLQSNISFIQQQYPTHLFPSTTHKIAEGLWLSRGAIIEKGASVIPPIYIGEEVRIKKGTSIGPNVVVERNCIIDSHSNLQNCIICKRTYIGESLEVMNSIIDRTLIINLSLGTEVVINDNLILGEMAPPSIKTSAYYIVEQLFAFILFVFLFPLIFILWLICGVNKEQVVFLPAYEEERYWHSFNLYSFNCNVHSRFYCIVKPFKKLLSLINVISGHLHFVGVQPRSAAEIKSMQIDWRNLYLRSKAGIITLAGLDYQEEGSEDEMQASEAFYTASMSLVFDLKILWRWFCSSIFQVFNYK